MKNLLFTLALLLSFSSFSQETASCEDKEYVDRFHKEFTTNDWSKRSLRTFFDNFEKICNRELREIEGIYSGSVSEVNPVYGESFYEVVILYVPYYDQYMGYTLVSENGARRNDWKKGDFKIRLEESALGGDFDVEWWLPAKRNKKGKVKKESVYYRTEAVSKFEGQTIKFVGNYLSGSSLIKKYPRL
tara:strand:+ start:39 stop:602 length:564 start_codon:yes stop_codon:yes gene_type:complete